MSARYRHAGAREGIRELITELGKAENHRKSGEVLFRSFHEMDTPDRSWLRADVSSSQAVQRIHARVYNSGSVWRSGVRPPRLGRQN